MNSHPSIKHIQSVTLSLYIYFGWFMGWEVGSDGLIGWVGAGMGGWRVHGVGGWRVHEVGGWVVVWVVVGWVVGGFMGWVHILTQP